METISDDATLQSEIIYIISGCNINDIIFDAKWATVNINTMAADFCFNGKSSTFSQHILIRPGNPPVRWKKMVRSQRGMVTVYR